jgi:hypothetical protein
VTVRLRLPSPAAQPARHRQQRPDHGPTPRPSCPRDTAEHVPDDQTHSQTGARHNHTTEQPS